MVEHSTADREVPGSNPGAPCYPIFVICYYFNYLLLDQLYAKVVSNFQEILRCNSLLVLDIEGVQLNAFQM